MERIASRRTPAGGENHMSNNLLRIMLGLLAGVLGRAADTGSAASEIPAAPLVLDMVHHNPGEPRYLTKYEDPAFVKQRGFTGKVYYLFDSPTLAVDWSWESPDILPTGSEARAWVDAKAADLDRKYAACAAAGLDVYAMADLILFPRQLVEKEGLQATFGDPTHPETQRHLRALIAHTFRRFPTLKGLVVRIGETYLHDAPHHVGKIDDKRDPDKTIIPLIRILREEICEKLDRQLVFRTWMSFDEDLATYLKINDAIEPHPKLLFGVKHCEGDFHRGHPFSKVIGRGRHRQLIEVQCAREYEGKGAYPNYIAPGVIHGFEEHLLQPGPERHHSIGEFARTNPLYGGIWTWSRGGGWDGPYIPDELWCDLNAYVVAHWAREPFVPEESFFNCYARDVLHLSEAALPAFRKLCLRSADAVVRGKSTTYHDLSPWWSRDDAITEPELPSDPVKRARIAEQQDEAVKIWEEIVRLADTLDVPDAATRQYIRASARYGLGLYRVYRATVRVALLAPDAASAEIRTRLAEYDVAWEQYRSLAQGQPLMATLYDEDGGRWGADRAIAAMIARYRKLAQP
jgi:hypothetical protein